MTTSARDDHRAPRAQWSRRYLIPVTEADEQTLRRFYEELMVPAFPRAELMSLDALRVAQSAGGVGGWLVMAGADPVAGMVTEDCVDGRVLLLSYLVVASHLRSQGVGQLLVDDLVAAGRARNMLVLAEIEDPRAYPAAPGNDPLARLRFYSRAGARRLPVPYIQPSLRPGSPRVPSLLLIVLGQTADTIESGLVVDFLDEYFAGCEGPEVLTSDAPYAALRRAAAGRNGVLRLLELDNLARPQR